MISLDIQAFTYEQWHTLVADLTAAFADCGGWVVERRTRSPSTLEFRVEIHMSGVLDLYASIVGTGVELTRAGHEALTELCMRRRHMRIISELGQIVALRLEIAFLEDIILHSLLAGGSGLA
jgi:hypothetical protein